MVGNEVLSGSSSSEPLCGGTSSSGTSVIGVTSAPDKIFAFVTGSPTPQKLFTSMADFLSESFLPLLPRDARIRAVYWSHEESVVRVWTIIDEPDDKLEEHIYKGQLQYMDKFPNLQYDFSVIYSFGKPLSSMKPEGAHLVTG